MILAQQLQADPTTVMLDQLWRVISLNAIDAVVHGVIYAAIVLLVLAFLELAARR